SRPRATRARAAACRRGRRRSRAQAPPRRSGHREPARLRSLEPPVGDAALDELRRGEPPPRAPHTDLPPGRDDRRAHRRTEHPLPLRSVAPRALDLRPADRVEERRRLLRHEQVLAAVVDLEAANARTVAQLAEPRPLRRRPLAEAAAAGRVRILVAGLVEARQRGVRRPREEPAVTEERLRLAEGAERAVGRQPALVRPPLLKLLEPAHRFLYSLAVASAVILTIGNELVAGDVLNTNGSWLAQRLEALGVRVRLLAALPAEIETVAGFVR